MQRKRLTKIINTICNDPIKWITTFQKQVVQSSPTSLYTAFCSFPSSSAVYTSPPSAEPKTVQNTFVCTLVTWNKPKLTGSTTIYST